MVLIDGKKLSYYGTNSFLDKTALKVLEYGDQIRQQDSLV